MAFAAARRLLVQPFIRRRDQLAVADAKRAGDAGSDILSGSPLVVFEVSEHLPRNSGACGEFIKRPMERFTSPPDDSGQSTDFRHHTGL